MARKDENAQGKAQVADRRRSALEYRKARMPYRLIGERLGISHVQAFRDVQAELKEVRKSTRESAEDLIELEVQQLDTAQLAIAGRVAKGDLAAIDRWLKLNESRRKLLGLDKTNETNLEGAVLVGVVRVPAKAANHDEWAQRYGDLGSATDAGSADSVSD